MQYICTNSHNKCLRVVVVVVVHYNSETNDNLVLGLKFIFYVNHLAISHCNAIEPFTVCLVSSTDWIYRTGTKVMFLRVMSINKNCLIMVYKSNRNIINQQKIYPIVHPSIEIRISYSALNLFKFCSERVSSTK